MKDSYMYKCVFMLDGDRSKVFAGNASTFIQGFWLDENFNIAIPGRGVWWIPASKIIFIKKEIIKREE